VTSEPQPPSSLEPEVAAFWAEFCAATGETGGPADVYAFGDSPALADQLLALVLSGRKTATTEMVARFTADEVALPRPGDLCVVTDGDGHPAAVVRTVDLRVGPMSSVEDAFAWAEGEGDRSVKSWQRDHEAYFRRTCRDLGLAYSPDLEVVFEQLELVWPVG
jgi:uncharacterized protein YhfF